MECGFEVGEVWVEVWEGKRARLCVERKKEREIEKDEVRECARERRRGRSEIGRV